MVSLYYVIKCVLDFTTVAHLYPVSMHDAILSDATATRYLPAEPETC